MPIKKLIAEEMSRGTESRKKSANVIARLMGFDGLKPHELSHKQQKKLSFKHLQRLAASGKSQTSSTSSSSRQSWRRSSKEHQEFKDIYEVLDTAKMNSSSFSQQCRANSKLTKAEKVLVKHKFLDATHLSTDDKFNDSKELHKTFDHLHSKNDLKFLDQPDSLFRMRVYDLRAASPSSLCHHVSGMKLSRSSETRLKNNMEKNRDPLGHSNNKHAADKSSKVLVEGKIDSSDLPTRIVVLKPNNVKVQNACRTVSSPSTLHDFHSDRKRNLELPSMSGEAKLYGNSGFHNDTGLLRYKSRECREIAKEITRQMRNSLESGSLNRSCGFRGCTGDKSSLDRCDNEPSDEPDMPKVICRNPNGWSNRYRPSTSRSAESFVSREACKRLSRRWTVAHRSVDMGLAIRGSTLGEMLGMPDREKRLANGDAMTNEKRFRDKFDGDVRPLRWVEPSISSRDGWKDEYTRNLSISSSDPASSCSTTGGRPKKDTRPGTQFNGRYLPPIEGIQKEIVKSAEGYVNQREGSSCGNSRFQIKQFHFSDGVRTDYSEVSQEYPSRSNQVRSSIQDDIPFEHYHIASNKSDTYITETSRIPVNVVDVAMPFESAETELPSSVLVKGNPSNNDQELSDVPPEEGPVRVQHCAEDLESLESSKEAEQPSPISVLETPFPNYLSSGSECFESLYADLHGLRMQLRLLKLESGAYEEELMFVASDKDGEHGSVGISEEKEKVEERREFSYVVDVLIGSGINDADPDTFMASWHSSECPLNLRVFEDLEKQHTDLNNWRRSERKLLFDRINSSLLVINQQFSEQHPWVRPARTSVSRWIKNGLGDSIHKLLASMEKKANKDAAEKALMTDSQWLDLRDDTDVVGREIEKLLTEELLMEIVAA